jgi:NADPH:quinone reductase-like Zn-dependent oxidoreductase
MLPPLPAILGNGVGGTVAEAGAGVDRGLTGRRVVTSGVGSLLVQLARNAHAAIEARATIGKTLLTVPR